MAKKGMIRLLPGKARGLKLTLRTSGIPLLGIIAAGEPREAQQEVDEVLPISPDWFRGTDLFALRVKGESMKDAGILSGDIAIINRQADVIDGEIAAVLMEDDATLKFVYREGDKVRLRGANRAFPDIAILRDECQQPRILGKYVGLVRSHRGGA